MTAGIGGRPRADATPSSAGATASPAGATGASDRAAVNNAFYDGLGERWYDAYDDPVALLRAEGELKNPWVAERIRAHLGGGPGRILDIGCGAGFLANALAAEGHAVTGADMSRGSLRIARAKGTAADSGGPGKRAAYRVADAYSLPFRSGTFDAVSALDFLEHVTEPERVIAEASRVLRPGGLFFFHTFNRNFLAWLIVIKGLEWFVRNTPRRMHVLPLFIKPGELTRYCMGAGMEVAEMTGMRPEFGRAAFWKMLATRRVPGDFKFRLTPSLTLSYMGYARKSPAAAPGFTGIEA